MADLRARRGSRAEAGVACARMASRQRKKRLAKDDDDAQSDNETEEWEAREGGGFARICPPTALKRVRRAVRARSGRHACAATLRAACRCT